MQNLFIGPSHFEMINELIFHFIWRWGISFEPLSDTRINDKLSLWNCITKQFNNTGHLSWLPQPLYFEATMYHSISTDWMKPSCTTLPLQGGWCRPVISRLAATHWAHLSGIVARQRLSKHAGVPEPTLWRDVALLEATIVAQHLYSSWLG